MEALFIVPCMVSPNINERLVPALAKMVERNILLNNSGLFQQAAFKKYNNNKSLVKKLLRMESSNLSESDNIDDVPIYMMSEYNIDESVTKFDPINYLFESPNTTLNESRTTKGQRINYQHLHDLGLFDEYMEATSLHRHKLNIVANMSPSDPGYDDAVKEAKVAAEHKYDIMKLAQESKKVDGKIRTDDASTKLNKDKVKKEHKLKIRELNHKTRMDVLRDARDAASSKRERKKMDLEIKALEDSFKQVGLARSGMKDYKPKMTYSKLDDVQDPGGITFFKQISIEPTFMDIPITVQLEPGRGAEHFMEIKVGIKCIPYFIDDVTNIVFLLREARHVNLIERKFKNALRSINKRVWFSKARAINKHGYVDPREAVNTIKYTPTRKEMENTKRVSKMFSTNKSPNWSTMIALSSFDLSDADLSDFIRNYKRMTEYLIGDIIIVNETKESAHFCTVRMNSCQELSFAYLRKVLNMDNVLDYNAVARQANPWKSEARPKKSRLSRIFGR